MLYMNSFHFPPAEQYTLALNSHMHILNDYCWQPLQWKVAIMIKSLLQPINKMAEGQGLSSLLKESS